MSRRITTQESRQEIIRNPLNDSTSKYSWSFSKSKRFQSSTRMCPHVAYNYNLDTKSSRKTSFGYGKRTSFKLNNYYVPPSSQYNIESQFQKRSNSKGISFGIGRNQTQIMSYIPLENFKVPGPGEYLKQDHQPPNFNTSRGFSMRPKTAYQHNYFIDDKEAKQIPGPGNYNDKTSTMMKSTLSKFKTTLTPNLNKTLTRWARPTQINPGPGTYLKPTQPNILSIYKNDPAKSIGKEPRVPFTQVEAKKSFTPGPGNYETPSDYGHYRNLRTDYH